MRILIITDSIPYPADSGGSVRIYNILTRIARQNEVWIAALQESPSQGDSVTHLEDLCSGVEIASMPRRRSLGHLPGLISYALAGKPLELKFCHNKGLIDKIRYLFSIVEFDIVQIEHSHMALYLETLPADLHYKSVLMFHDIVFRKYDRISRIEHKLGKKMRALLYSSMMRRWEPRIAERFDRCITVSDLDRDLMIGVNPRLQIQVVANGVDTKVLKPLPQQDATPTLIFVGNMSYQPCVDAVLYFYREILPNIRSRIEGVQFFIVGKNPPPQLIRLNGDGVHVTGKVDEVVPYYERSTVCVVPLRAGSGTRLKILESMALGRAVVSTVIGCEGLDVIDGKHLLIADRPELFTEKTVRLLTDRRLYHELTFNARKLVMSRYDWDVIAKKLIQIYGEILE